MMKSWNYNKKIYKVQYIFIHHKYFIAGIFYFDYSK